MNRFFILFKKEFKQLYLSLIGFLSIIIFPLFMSIWVIYIERFFNGINADFDTFWGLYPTMFIIFIPIISLKLWNDDFRFKTTEIILTLPYSELQIILVRYTVVLVLYFSIFLLSLIFPLSALTMGNFDKGIIFTNSLGILLNGSASIAISLFITVIFSGSLISWLISTLILVFLNGSVINNPIISPFTFTNHMESFSRGLLNIGDIMFFLIIIGFFLYFSSRLIYLRRWN